MHNLLPKLDELIRIGLIPITQLPVLKRAITYFEQGMVMPTVERVVFYSFVNKILGLSLNDPTLFRGLKQKILTKRAMSENLEEGSTGTKQVKPSSDDIKAQVAKDIAARKAKKEAALKDAAKEMQGWKPDKKDIRKIYQKEEIELHKAPEGMLMNFANIVKSKVRAGGRPTEGDRKLASKAKNELRRRRNVASKRMVPESVDYNVLLTDLLTKYNVGSIGELTDEQKAEVLSAL